MICRRGVAAVGDAENVGTWSGIPHYLLCAGRSSGFLNCGLDLGDAHQKTTRFGWQVGRVLHGERPRGYQYSAGFLAMLGKTAVSESRHLDVQEVISHYQLLPARELLSHCVHTTFYIDTTLRELFATQEMDAWLNPWITREALEFERAEYHAAARVITMATWPRQSLEQDYGLPSERIYTVLPGANLPEAAVQERLRNAMPPASPDRFTRRRPLRIGFTGKDWKRKGLKRLAEAVVLLNRIGIPAEIMVIGDLPLEYRTHPHVRPAGFIDKARDTARFIETLMTCDLGCAPSHEEPMGIAPMEYLRLGVPVICTAAGGLADVCRAAGAASVMLPKDATAEEIATALESVASDPGKFQRMRDAAWERKEYFSWDRTVRELRQLWES